MAETVECIVEEERAGLRLDVYLAEAVEDASRSLMQRLIKEGRVTIDGAPCGKGRRKVKAGERVQVEIPPPPPAKPAPEDLPLDILFEDEHLLFINKASGMVVHPAPGHYTGTLVNAVLHHCAAFQQSGGDAQRPGIVHRLDRFTSGVMIVAKAESAFRHLAAQAAAHSFERQYLALVRGEFEEERGRITASIGRSIADRTRMAVTAVRAKDAVTNFEVRERFGCASLLALWLDTGRTHQIRVHMRFTGKPVLGDPIYGVTDFSGMALPPEVQEALAALPGQALHAERLGIVHPATGKAMAFSAPPPAPFQRALEALREAARTA